MDVYSLQSDEVVLYKGDAHLQGNKSSSELLLTNINIVLITKTKKLFSKEEVDLKIFPVQKIKIYDNAPQVKLEKQNVEIYFTDTEIVLYFYSTTNAHKFLNAITKLTTGKSVSERSAEKVKGVLNVVDSALGISTVGTIKSVVENGITGSVLGAFGKKSPLLHKGGSTINKVMNVAETVLGKGSHEVPTAALPATPSMDEQIEMLKKLKELLDSGIITQEEFETKKKQIMHF